MKKIVIGAILALSAASAFAFPLHFGERVYFAAELKALEAEYGTRNLGQLTVAELIPAAGRLDVARQKDRRVDLATGLSMAWPGAGQYSVGEWASGTLHMGLHVGVVAGSLVWAHALLPSDLRVSHLNYFGDSQDTIDAAWNSHSIDDFWPSIGALSAGFVVDLAVRAWSAGDARVAARNAIDEGKITFEPRFDGHHWGFGARF